MLKQLFIVLTESNVKISTFILCALIIAIPPVMNAAESRAQITITPPSGTCKLSAYIIDPDPHGLNVHGQPNSKAPVSAVLPKDSDGTIVDVSAGSGLWLYITHAKNISESYIFKGKGWVYGPMLGTETRSKASLRVRPDEKSAVTEVIGPSIEVVMRGCYGDWSKVSYKNLDRNHPRRAHLGRSERALVRRASIAESCSFALCRVR